MILDIALIMRLLHYWIVLFFTMNFAHINGTDYGKYRYSMAQIGSGFGIRII